VGITYIEGTVVGSPGKQAEARFRVERGATYTLLPNAAWRAIELTPQRRLTFVLANGTTVERGVSECLISLPQGEGHTAAILGEAGDTALLGTVTLEILGVDLEPVHSSIAPMRALLA